MQKIIFFLFLAGLLFSCQDEVPVGPVSPKNIRINTFTTEKMSDKYFWAEEVRDKMIDLDSITLSIPPEEFFKKMIYDGDPWSHISKVPNLEEVAAAEDGYDEGFGYNLTFWQIEEVKDLIYSITAEVNYVYPNTPAEKAGLKRGDLITRMNGKKIAMDKYTDLYYQPQLKSIGISSNIGEEPYKTIENLIAQKTTINPILYPATLNINGEKIGYMLYTSFVYRGTSSISQLNNTFQTFKSEGVDEFILDLRYNAGGYIEAARHLSSLLAPEMIVQNEELLIHKTWNREYQEKYANTPDELEERFDKSVPVSAQLNLPRLWVITGRNTASASEMLISGLSPYMDVKVIGSVTKGKNMGGITFTPSDSDLKGWNITLITLEYTNSRGQSVKDGIIPRYIMDEEAQHDGALGSLEDPLIAETVKLITGQPLPTTSAGSRTSAQKTANATRVVREILHDRSVLLYKDKAY